MRCPAISIGRILIFKKTGKMGARSSNSNSNSLLYFSHFWKNDPTYFGHINSSFNLLINTSFNRITEFIYRFSSKEASNGRLSAPSPSLPCPKITSHHQQIPCSYSFHSFNCPNVLQSLFSPANPSNESSHACLTMASGIFRRAGSLLYVASRPSLPLAASYSYRLSGTTAGR